MQTRQGFRWVDVVCSVEHLDKPMFSISSREGCRPEGQDPFHRMKWMQDYCDV